jgi:hypothetical protein
MKNKLLITTALASSLVAGSAIAQTTVTGSLGVSYKSVQGKNSTANGNSFGKESQINVANKGKLNIGGLSYAAGFSLEFDGADGIYTYTPGVGTTTGTASNAAGTGATIAFTSASWASFISNGGAISVTTTATTGSVTNTAATGSGRQTGSSGWHLENNYIDIISESTGTTLTISSDHIQNARGGLAHIVGQHAEDFTGGVNNTTTSLAMDYAGTSVAESFGIGLVQNVGKLGKVSYLYVPNHTAQGAQSGKNSVLQAAGVVADDGDAVLGSDDLPNAYEYGFIGDLGVKGLTVKAFKNVEGIKKNADGVAAISKTKGQNLGIRYNYDVFTVGVNQMKSKAGGTTAATDNLQTKQMEYGLGFAVNKDLSVGLYMNKAKKDGAAADEKTQTVAVGYSLGPVALSAQYGNVDNMGGVAEKDANVLFMSLTTAF